MAASGGELHHLPKAPFSVHARGVQLLDRGRLLDGPYIGLSAFRSLRDISGSLYTFVLIQASCQARCGECILLSGMAEQQSSSRQRSAPQSASSWRQRAPVLPTERSKLGRCLQEKAPKRATATVRQGHCSAGLAERVELADNRGQRGLLRIHTAQWPGGDRGLDGAGVCGAAAALRPRLVGLPAAGGGAARFGRRRAPD